MATMNVANKALTNTLKRFIQTLPVNCVFTTVVTDAAGPTTHHQEPSKSGVSRRPGADGSCAGDASRNVGVNAVPLTGD